MCSYVGYLAADYAWYSIEWDCDSLTNPAGIIFSRFWAAFGAFIFGFILIPIMFQLLKCMFACFGCNAPIGVDDAMSATTRIIVVQSEITVESTV